MYISSGVELLFEKNKKTNFHEFISPMKGYLRETCKSQNINLIYLNLKVTFRISP